MGGLSPLHLILLAVVAILFLGGGRFSALMGDGKGYPDHDPVPIWVLAPSWTSARQLYFQKCI